MHTTTYKYKKLLTFSKNWKVPTRIFSFWQKKWLFLQNEILSKFRPFKFIWKKRYIKRTPFKKQYGYFINFKKPFTINTTTKRRILKTTELKYIITKLKTKKIKATALNLKKNNSFLYFIRLYSQINFILLQSNLFKTSKELKLYYLYKYIYINNLPLNINTQYGKQGDIITFNYKSYKFLYKNLLKTTSINLLKLKQIPKFVKTKKKERPYKFYLFFKLQKKKKNINLSLKI